MFGLLQRFRGDQRGNVAVLFGLAAVPIMGVMGVAVDYSRASHFRSLLQSAVDSAALAGATATSHKAIRDTVDSVMEATLPGSSGLNAMHYSTDIDPESVTVSANAQVPTTIAAILRDKMPVAVSATASRGKPVRVVDISVTNFNADAWDANSIYWYIVPKDDSVPADSDLHLLLSNDPVHPVSSAPDSVQIGPEDEIGFAMINVTGGVHPYGANSYGQPQGSVHKFYSQQLPENLHAAGYADCKSGTVQHAWDDNGGGADDNDYNDAVYDFSCKTVKSDPKTVVLIR
jgi:Flp pilus assembly protein TadG